MKKFIVAGYFIVHISVVILHAQSQHLVQNQYKFKYLTVDQGLSNNWVKTICQDANGFIWIGTEHGANKFDGQTLISFLNNPNDTSTISSNSIYAIFLDSKLNLWLGSSEGLDIYNANTESFTQFKHKDIHWSLGSVFDLTEDKNGVLWIGSVSGLYAYNLNTSEIRHFSNKKNNPHGFPENYIHKLLVDTKNNLWISVLDEGLCVYNQNDNSIKCFRNDPKNSSSISGNRIESLYEDKKGNIWAGTLNNGINLYVPETNSFQRIIPDPENIYSTRVREIFEDLKANLFIGTRCGLYILDRTTNAFSLYAYEGHNYSSLSQNSIFESFIDNTGTLWIGTNSGGVNYTNLNGKEFIHYKSGKNDNQLLNGGNINAITGDQQGNLWIGVDDGLHYLDRKSNTFQYFLNNPEDPSSLSYNDVKALDWDKNGNLWVGTNKGGLNYFDIKAGKFKSYRHNPDDPSSIAGDKIYGLMNDLKNNLWIVSSQISNPENLNIDFLANGSDTFIHLNEKGQRGFDQNKNGDIYIGGKRGFWIFSDKDSSYSFIKNDTMISNVNALKNDSKGRLWIGSSKGLVRYNKEDKSFQRFSVENGFPVSEVYGILEDDAKSLWVSTNLGLIKITNIVEDTEDIKFRIFDQEDGLQSKQFNYNAFYKSNSGEMAFGGINGFNTFYPSNIIEDTVPPNVIITELKIFNLPAPIGKKIGDRIVLEKSISVTKKISLGPKNNVFTLEFAALHYANPEKNIFKYKLEGFDKEWQFRKANNNFATYTSLPPGEYTFLVSAANSDGVWNEEPVRLTIVIIPPIWKTWWFKTLSALFLFGMITGIYFYRLHSIGHRNKELEDALAQAKESEELKSAFLANMSHEIRTPMNAIIGFTTLLFENGKTPEDRIRYKQIIETNSQSLLKIIDGILDMSMIESNQLKLVMEIFDLNQVIDHLHSYYFLKNNNSKVEFRIKNTLESLHLKLLSDTVRLKQILTNLMDNARKFTKEGFIELGTLMDEDYIHIYVEDSGRGIPPDKTKEIFQQFTKLEDDETLGYRGLGLGLAISQKIAIAMDGKLSLKSTPGKGSTFTLSISKENLRIQEEIPTQETTEPKPRNWKGKTLLIVEDIEENFIYLNDILKKTKTNILCAKNGVEAITHVMDNSSIDLILMDIKMPVMNGTDAAKKIKEHNPAIKIIAQTAYARPGEKLKFFDENFDDYISKPIKPEDLIMVLEKFL